MPKPKSLIVIPNSKMVTDAKSLIVINPNSSQMVTDAIDLAINPLRRFGTRPMFDACRRPAWHRKPEAGRPDHCAHA